MGSPNRRRDRQRSSAHPSRIARQLSLFAVIGLLSIYPTFLFLSWRAPLKQGVVPVVEPGKLRVIRTIIHWELAGLVVLVLCAALMARGIGR